MKLYCLYDKVQNKILAEMDSYSKDVWIIGAVDPAKDGNYFKKLIISGVLEEGNYKMGLRGWWKWVQEQENNPEVSDEFSFNEEDIEIRELNLGDVF